MEFLRISAFQPFVVFLLFAVVYFPFTVRSDEIIPLLLPSDQSNQDICPTTSSPTESCTINCFRPDPVCGVNGVTYWCGCPDAQCAGVRVVKSGICEATPWSPPPLGLWSLSSPQLVLNLELLPLSTTEPLMFPFSNLCSISNPSLATSGNTFDPYLNASSGLVSSTFSPL
ncbi:hypothetical protein HAX54_046001 [Datura stramonium]|uniref:Uncharacterized protein n=1 Tax=Datura stramonium TaxID=4076 RepID=A0ABS8SRI0_DATST|nr:hypothetical protein [Datura stramonium]